MRERQKVFVERIKEYKEMREDEENEKKKLVCNHWRKMKRREHLVAKLRVV